MSNARLYWICQLSGWAVYALLNMLLVNMYYPIPLRASLGLLTYGLAGVLVTHGLRHWIQRTGLLGKNWQTILWQALVAIPIGAMLLTALIMLFWRLLVASQLGKMQISMQSFVLGTFFNMHFMIALWLAIYITVHLIWSRFASREAQLQALQAQINPHFLFNSLNGLRGLILENPHAAQEMVTRLAQLLRYSLHQSRQSTVTLADELDAVRDYLAIEKIRFEDRLQIHWQLDADAASVPIPPMSLQTLVENALKHGIANQPEGGTVHIRTQLQSNTLCMEVSSPGMLQISERNGTGLSNLQERLKLLHGPLARLRLEKKDGAVLATIQLPCAL